MFYRLIPLLLILLIPPFTLNAQEEEHPPQFLYRDGDQLVLVSIVGEDAEVQDLPLITAHEFDKFQWSPNGQYLLVLAGHEGAEQCLNLYDIEELRWLYARPIACSVTGVAFSHDATKIAYTTFVEDVNGAVWVYNLTDQVSIQITMTDDGDDSFPSGISDIAWSPNDNYLQWVRYHWILGGTLNQLQFVQPLTSCEDYDHPSSIITISGGDWGYYADYNPIWSPDGEWFLLILQDEYVTSGTLPLTNHQGDVYLVHAADGEQYRLTYTPAERESNIRWTEDGRVAFEIVQSVYLDIEDALSIPEPNSIVQPEYVEQDEMFLQELYVFEESDLAAWVISKGVSPLILHIGEFSRRQHAYSAQLGEDYNLRSGIIGWRPTGNGDS